MLQTRQVTRRRPDYVPGQLFIRIAEPAVRAHLEPTPLRLTAESARRLPESVAEPLEYLRTNAGLKDVRPLFSTQRDRVAQASVSVADRSRLAILSSVADSETEELVGINVVSVDAKKVDSELLRTLSRSRTVDYVEPVPTRWLASGAADPLRNLQWGLRAVGWFQARIPDASDVRVAVMDSGIDERHPDLRKVDLAYHHRGLSGEDIVGHGTHVSGIIAADSNNDIGISGIANCQLSVWKVFSDKPVRGDYPFEMERFLQALRAAQLEGVRVVSLSMGGGAPSKTERDVLRVVQREGIVVVAAVGNEYQMGNPVEYPAAYDEVVGVGAITEDRRRAADSNTGPHVDLVAPGSSVLSTLPTRRSRFPRGTWYGSCSGTSFATPHVTAAIALAAARFPEESGPRLVERLLTTSMKLPAMRGHARTREYGFGLLNLVDYLA